MPPYDSRPDTYAHIATVRLYLSRIIQKFLYRMEDHDMSKLVEPELSVFNEFTPKLKDSTYGSPEYNRFLVEMGVGLEHHYQANDHHPEHFPNGIREMDLLQMTEMLCDWKAATLRHANGDLGTSITQNRVRFGYGDETERLLRNTARNMGWL